MKKKILFILTCILMLIIAGCGSKNTTNNVNNENNTASETDIENAKKTNEKNHMSIEEAIQANLRYDAGSGPVLYADEDGTLYASSNTTGALKTMNTLYTSGKSSGIIKQLEIVESSALLDEEGQLFYCGDHCFPGYVITSFDMSREDERLVAVTENGSVIYCTGLCYADDRENMPVHKIPEWNSVKYVRCVEKDGVLAVNTDGTASIYAEYDDTIAKWGKFDISDWTDIEWICSFEADADQNAIIGLKSDGTLTAVGNYPKKFYHGPIWYMWMPYGKKYMVFSQMEPFFVLP